MYQSSIAHHEPDLYYSNATYDAMSMSIHVETATGREDKFSLQQWYDTFKKLCGSKACNLLTFELKQDTKLPTVNNFYYKFNQTASFKNTLDRPEALSTMQYTYPAKLTEVIQLSIL